MSSSRQSAGYWDEVLTPFWQEGDGGAWRGFCDALHWHWLQSGLGNQPLGRVLKTDLFDEAAGIGLLGRLEARGGEVHGVDVSPVVASQARKRTQSNTCLSGSVLQLPYKDGVFDLVVSNSTLDHFTNRADLVLALRELRRVLRPGGQMMISLDNMANPAIALRQALPFEWLNRIGLVPYFVGESVTPEGMAEVMREAGFEVVRQGTLLHAPRAIALPLCERFPALVRLLLATEVLDKLPTARWTGYFTTALVRRPL